jgi:hypothetical protein
MKRIGIGGTVVIMLLLAQFISLRSWAQVDGGTAGDLLGSLGFSAGLGVMFLPQPDILEAQIINGIVRVKREEYQKIGLWLETNYVFDVCGGDYIAPGFFIGTQLINVDGKGEVFNSVAGGPMISFRRLPLGAGDNKAINLGAGYFITHLTVLGDHVHENKPAPPNEDEVRTKSISTQGWMAMVSFQITKVSVKRK